MGDRSAQTPEGVACEWTVSGMDCGSCVTKVRRAVERLPGVSGVEVLLMRERLRLFLDPAHTSREDVEGTVRALGYKVSAPDKARRSFGGRSGRWLSGSAPPRWGTCWPPRPCRCGRSARWRST